MLKEKVGDISKLALAPPLILARSIARSSGRVWDMQGQGQAW